MGLSHCPSSPNCVSSDATDSRHRIPALQLAVAPAEAWRSVREVVMKLPRTRIVDETEDYLHAEYRSAVFGFVDDLELQLRPSERIIAVRSASRLGYSDLGVNRRRVEALRENLARGRVESVEIESPVEIRRPSRGEPQRSVSHQHAAVDGRGRLDLAAGHDASGEFGRPKTPRQGPVVGPKAVDVSVPASKENPALVDRWRRIDASAGGERPDGLARPLIHGEE